MAVSTCLVVLMTMLASAYSQTQLPLAGANVLVLGVTGDLYPVRFYDGVFRIQDGTTNAQVQINVIDLDECARACVNSNFGVVPPNNLQCNAFEWFPNRAVGANCITHIDCSTLSTNFMAPNPVEPVTHYKVVHLCDNGRLIRQAGQTAVDVNNLPVGVSIVPVASQTNAQDCGLWCDLRVTCIAADYSTNTGCRNYETPTATFGDCIATTNTVGFTAYTFPCNVAPFGGVKPGLVPNAVAQAPTADDFFACRTRCENDAECIGYRYETLGEFLIAGDAGAATRCQLYDKYAVGTSIACQVAVPERNLFTILKFPCRFNSFPDMRKVGGIPQPQWRTLYECERECHFDLMCTGYDWNKDTTTLDRNRCWFHTEYRGGCENMRATTMVDHFDVIDSRCSINADDLYIFTGVQVSGTGTVGTPQLAATTYALCRDACNNDLTCQGFEFIMPTTCITHTADTVCNNFIPNAMAVHYRKMTYECMWRFRNSKRSGGMAQNGVSILGKCEEACRMTVGCLGFDFDRTGRVPGTPCFLHLTGTVCNPLVRAPDVEHYRVRTHVCPNELDIIAIANWGNAMQNVHTIGNQRQGVEQSAIQCAETCVRLGNRLCAGIEYERKTGFCYIATRNNACQSTASPLNFVDRIQLAQGCNAPTVTGYTGTGSQHRLGGQLVDSNSNPDECAGICNRDSRCRAFDFDRTNNECWTHSRTNECRLQMSTFSNFCCDHYVNSTQTCTGFTAPILVGYTLRDMLHVPAGAPVSPQLAVVTEELCRQHCDSQAACTSFDFNFARNVCYVHTSTTSCNPEAPHLLVHRYVKGGNCGF